MLKAKLNKSTFVNDLNAFDNFLDHVAPAVVIQHDKSREAGLQIISQAAKLLQQDASDDDSNFLSDSDDDEYTASLNRRQSSPRRGIRTDHSGDLERMFQGPFDNLDVQGSASSKEKVSTGEKIVIKGSLRRRAETDEPKRSDDDGSPPRLGHRSHRSGQRPSTEEKPKSVESLSMRASSHSTGSGSPTSSKDRSSRRRRDDLAQSEHVKPRLRRTDLYSSNTRPASGLKKEGRQAASEIDFQTALAAAKRRQAAGGSSLQRRSHAPLSPIRKKDSSNALSTLRRSSGQRNSSAELSQTISRIPRSQASMGSLSQTNKGSRNNLRMSSLEGVYSSSGALDSSSPKPSRKSLSACRDAREAPTNTNRGRRDIDNLVLNLKRQSKTSLLKTKHGNATWNLAAGDF